MNTLDIIIGIFLVAGLIRGFIKGFIYEIAVLGCLFLGYFIGFKLADMAAPHAQKMLGINGSALRYVSFFVVWIVISVGIFFLAKLFEGLVNIAALGVFNKLAGAVFGLVKHLLIASLILYFFNKPASKYQWVSADTRAESKLYYPLVRVAESVM